MAERIEECGPTAVENKPALFPRKGPVVAREGGPVIDEVEDVVVIEVEPIETS